jgi:glycosyltransferase involved in cell wall biosynthesis
LPTRFSVLVPVFNHADYVRQTIDSILSQSFTGFEVVAVDDGSTDGSLAILESYGKQITVIRQDRKGPEAARNQAAKAARGEYFALLDADDRLLPHALEVYDRVIREFDAPPLIVGGVLPFQHDREVDSAAVDGSEIHVARYADYFSKDVMALKTSSSMVMKRAVFESVARCGSLEMVPAPDDIHLILAVGTASPCVVVLKPNTIAYRDYPGKASHNVDAMASGILRMVKFERQGRYPGGRERRAARYTTLGAFAGNYAYRYCWLEKRRKAALKIFFAAAPIILSAYRQRQLRRLRPPTEPIVLRNERAG